MSKWEMVRLGDVASLINGRAYKQEELLKIGKTPVLRVGNFFSNRDWYYSDLDLDENKYCNEGDLLFAWSASFGPKIWDGPKVIFHYHIWRLILSEDIDKKYLFYLLHNSTEKIKAQGRGIAMIHVTKSGMEQMKIPLPPLEVQKKIAKTLDASSQLIALRKKQLVELDNLIKATFYDIFGDPVVNEKGWEIKKLYQLVIKSKNSLKRGPFGGALKKEIFVNKGYLVYEQNHALNNDYSFKRYFIDQKTFSNLQDFEVKPGDILVSCSGVYLGKLSIVPQGALPGIINQALLKITLDINKMNRVFFVYVFSNPNFRNKNIASTRGSGIPNLPPMSTIKNIDFITPPIQLQSQFEEIVTKIEEQKTLVQKSIDESQYLFDCLMSQYFE